MIGKLGVVVLAAGQSRRFGRNKLLEDVGGKAMLEHAFEAAKGIGASCAVSVVSCNATADLARHHGFDVIMNDAPERGQAFSVVLGCEAMREMDAILFLAGDQPRLTQESLLLLVSSFAKSGKGIACLEDETHRGNPAIFASRYFKELLALRGDRGAKGILRAHEDDLLCVRCLDAHELIDADTPQALEEIRQMNG